ncbi:uncharacterized protein LOC129953384 [Eupeodes corollae]|uniref:uncharacterized protein LOC129953384 n=1 Tax=Eupeodes corollae TaxID=290404 RepID=UPI00249054E3|nr:uncharacterized protein LOC129953384 [Eupeodes corollae]XP_055922513.1 uncharacterized protein LOC129953384 [Eupeodes corollae]
MRHYTKKNQYHATRIIQIILLLIFPLRSCSVNGQISHHTEYEIATGRRSGGNGASGASGGASSDSNEDESISSQPNRLHTNGEILGPKSFPLSAQEPSCEELRAMWIFSKRQSRAAEMSNEIPTYRDPFAYNVWEPMYNPGRGIGSRTIPHYREPNRPVFGRVISREPVVLQRLPARSRILFDEVPARLYGSETRSTMPSVANGVGTRRTMQYRFSGTPPYGNPQNNNPNLVHQGSFQKLKELIWTERAKELTQQRKAEELAARAAVLKELSAGQLINRQLEQNDEPMPNEQNLSPDQPEHLYHHNNMDGRIAIGMGKQPGGMKSIFSGNPSNPNSARSGRLLLPSMIGGDARERGNLQRNFPMRPSHFRERNRVLFRQSTPSDFYQRESRSGSLKSLPFEHEVETNSESYSSENDRNRIDNKNTMYPSNDFQHLTTGREIQKQQQQQQLSDILQKIYQIDQLSFLTEYPSSLTSKPNRFNYDENINIDSEIDSKSRNRRNGLSNIDFIKHSSSSDSY